MRTLQFAHAALVGVLIAGGFRQSQAQALSSSLPHLRTIDQVLATSPVLKAPVDVRQLSDGRVLVNDGVAHQVVLFDGVLSHPMVVLDSAGPPDRRYGRTSGALIAYLGDSTLFLDRASNAFLVIDPSGTIVRTMSAATGGRGNLAAGRLDARGRVIYEQNGARNISAGRSGDGVAMSIVHSYVFGFDLTTRRLDTAVIVREDTTRPPAGGTLPALGTSATIYPVSDTWTLMADGTIAVVRARDYRIDWYGADGKRKVSPKVSHEWTHLSDAEKQRLADSTTIVRDSANQTRLAAIAKEGKNGCPKECVEVA